MEAENILIVQLLPLAESDSEADLFEQGMNIDEIEIKPGEKFKIPEDHEHGTIDCEFVKYKLITWNEFSHVEEIIENEDVLVLVPGIYLFENDGITIKRLK